MFVKCCAINVASRQGLHAPFFVICVCVCVVALRLCGCAKGCSLVAAIEGYSLAVHGLLIPVAFVAEHRL